MTNSYQSSLSDLAISILSIKYYGIEDFRIIENFKFAYDEMENLI